MDLVGSKIGSLWTKSINCTFIGLQVKVSSHKTISNSIEDIKSAKLAISLVSGFVSSFVIGSQARLWLSELGGKISIWGA